MIFTGASIDKLLKDIEEVRIKNIDSLIKKMKNIHECYPEEEWKYYCGVIEQESGVKIKDITPGHLEKIIRDWKESVIKLNNMILKDAEKEFDSNAQIGYGIDGDKEIQSKDFKAVRGTTEQNKFIKGLMNDSKKTEETAEKILNFLNQAVDLT